MLCMMHNRVRSMKEAQQRMRRRKKRRREKARKGSQPEAGAAADGGPHANGDGPAEDGDAVEDDGDEGTVEAGDELVLLQVWPWFAPIFKYAPAAPNARCSNDM